MVEVTDKGQNVFSSNFLAWWFTSANPAYSIQQPEVVWTEHGSTAVSAELRSMSALSINRHRDCDVGGVLGLWQTDCASLAALRIDSL